ncbi:MAG TPA: PQQ-dependent sugar dehydrogenase, partial [Gammaproteobacteria bacterium]
MTANRAGPCLVITSLLLLEACHSSDDDDNQTPPPPPGVTVGLDSRPSNLSCVAPAKTVVTGTAIQLQRAFPNLTFDQPVAMLQAPGDDSRWFVVQKGGTVRVFANTATPTASNFIALTVNSNSEGGLLGMAFHPQWSANRQVFLSFTESVPMVSVIARYTISANGLTADPATRADIIKVNQPADNHNGGQIAFGSDTFLYFGLGDGGNGGDSPQMTGQDTTDLLGSFLRLDIDTAGAAYEIPPDNPFAGAPTCPAAHTVSANNCPEIYAWGFRNPWRWSFDSATGDLWAGDVGQGAREEIDRVQRGGNYGWNCREGLLAYNGCPTPSTNFIDPVHDYGRSLGTSVTGGYVYRGSAIPGLVGSYLFSDYGSGIIWRLVPNGSGGFTSEQMLDTSLGIASFGQGNDGELYVVDLNGGGLHKIVPAGGGTPSSPVPTLLSQTGCVNA